MCLRRKNISEISPGLNILILKLGVSADFGSQRKTRIVRRAGAQRYETNDIAVSRCSRCEQTT